MKQIEKMSAVWEDVYNGRWFHFDSSVDTFEIGEKIEIVDRDRPNKKVVAEIVKKHTFTEDKSDARYYFLLERFLR